MSAAEVSLKEKMARLKAKREADAAAKAGGGGVLPAASAALHGARPAPPVGGATAAAGSAGRPAAAAVAGRAAPLVGTPVPIKAPPRPGSNSSNSSAAARPAAAHAATLAPPGRSGSQTARPAASAAAAAPSIVAPVAAASAVPKRRIQKKPVQPADAAAAAAGAAVSTAATPAPSPSISLPTAATPTPTPAPAPSAAGVKRKKHSAPAAIVQLVSNAEAESLSKKPRVSLANTDHLGGFSRDTTRNNSHEAGMRRPTAEEKCTLWIENLAEGVTGDDLRPLLSPFGHIEEFKIGMGRSYGTIRFRTRDAASMVVEQVHDSMLAGSAVQISWYQPRERGAVLPSAPASTAQPDLDRYHELGAAPASFAALLRDYKPLVAARPRLPPDSARHIRVPPSTTLGAVGVLTRSAARARADAAAPPLPQLPTDLPPRELVPYGMLEY